LVFEIDAGRLVAYLFCIFKKNTNTTSVMVKIVIVIESPRQLWSKPMWWCILKFKQKKHHVSLVPKPTWCRDTQRRSWGTNRHCVSLHHVGFGTIPMWCFFYLVGWS